MFRLVLPLIAFILGRNALIFQNPLFFTTFFRNFAPVFSNDTNLLLNDRKIN